MRREELASYLSDYLQISLFTDYCHNGIQVEGKPEIHTVATAVSAHEATIQQAVEQEVDALIVHHGLFWENGTYCITGPLRRKLSLLLDNEITLFAYHLPLDAHREVGNNWLAARELGWKDLLPFGLHRGIDIGVRGTFPPCSLETLVAQVEKYYGHRAHVAPGGKRSLSSGALISGGAYRELTQAARVGVDCYITGNFDEPAWGAAQEEKIHFLALGHAATEKIGTRALARHVEEECGIKTLFLDDLNPF